MEITTHKFKKELHRHLGNERLRTNVNKATWLSLTKRRKTLVQYPQWEEMRENAHQIKGEIIDNIEENLKIFTRNAEKKGIVVKTAADAVEANRLVQEIITQHQGKMVVKAKSMLTEEIDLNENLQKAGIKVWETDLGEFILQLAGEAPSHLIGPAIHKSKEEIAQLLHEKLGCNNDPTPEYLTSVVREYLRKKYVNADIGISGTNFIIRDKGSIVLLENEGNIRLSYSNPKVHIALMGIEKMIPSFEDLSLFIPLLGVSANGQKTTGYMSIVNSPRKSDEIDGPEHVYFILVDNGRRRIWKDKKLRKALYCIRCSACYNICPVYRNIGGHAYGWVYQGPIGAVITPHLVGLKKAKDLPFATSLCGDCTDICPVKIPLHHLHLYNRYLINKKGFPYTFQRMIFIFFSIFMYVPGLYSVSSYMAKKVLKMFKNEPKVPGWSKSRAFPAFAKRSFKQLYKEMEK